MLKKLASIRLSQALVLISGIPLFIVLLLLTNQYWQAQEKSNNAAITSEAITLINLFDRPYLYFFVTVAYKCHVNVSLSFGIMVLIVIWE